MDANGPLFSCDNWIKGLEHDWTCLWYQSMHFNLNAKLLTLPLGPSCVLIRGLFSGVCRVGSYFRYVCDNLLNGNGDVNCVEAKYCHNLCILSQKVGGFHLYSLLSLWL